MNAVKNKRNGFTLIELLVVISIIAILMAVLMPALTKAREQAKKIVCASQQKDIGMALNLYAQDWDGNLPRGWWSQQPGTTYTRLPYKLAPYYDREGLSEWDFEMYSCPGQPKILTDSQGNDVIRGESAVGSYGYNEFFFLGLNPGGRYPSNNAENWVERKISDIVNPSGLPLHGCLSGEQYQNLTSGGGQRLSYRGPHPNAFKYGFMGGIKPATRNRVDVYGPAPNHGRDCNMLMGDFSVDSVNVTVDGEFPWTEFEGQDYTGDNFHPSRASSNWNQTR